MNPEEYILNVKEKYGTQRTRDGQLIRDMNDRELLKRMVERYPDDRYQIQGLNEYLGEETPEQPQEKDSVASRIGKAVAMPFARLGVNAVKAGQMIAGQEVDPAAPVNVPWLGEVKPVGQEGSFGQKVFDAIGTGADIASTVIPAGKAGSLAKMTFKGAVKEGIETGAKAGALSGTLAGAGSEMQNPDATVGSVVTQGTIGGAVGAAGGAVVGGALPVPVAGIGKAKNAIASHKDTVYKNTVNKRVSVLEGLQGTNKPLDRKIQTADKAGIDTKRVLAESDLLVNAIDKEGTVHTKNAMDNLSEVLRPWESKVGDALAQENKLVSLADVQKKMLTTIDGSDLVGSVKQQAKARALQELEALAQEADEAGNVPLKLIHDLKVQINKTNAKSFIDPEKNAIGKTVGRGFKEFVEDSTDALDVKSYNQELRKFYAVRDVLEALDGKKVKGGRLGKYFAQVVGGMAGGQIGGPIGAVAGAELGGAVRGIQMSRAFGGAQGKALQPTQKMQSALQLPNKSAAIKNNTAPMIANTKPAANVQTIPATAKPSGSVVPQISDRKLPQTSRTQNQPTNPSKISNTISSQNFAGGIAGFETDEDGELTFNPEHAALGVLGIAGAQRLTRTQAAKKFAEFLDQPTRKEAENFITAVRNKGVYVKKDGSLGFKAVADLDEQEVETAFLDGLQLLELSPNTIPQGLFNSVPAKIANFYEEVLHHNPKRIREVTGEFRRQ